MKNTVSVAGKTEKLVGIALLSAIVIVLQLVGSFIRFGIFSVSLVLVPIVIGAALYGVSAGMWLGFAFAIAVFVSQDANTFLAINPLGTVVTVLLKGVLAGLVAGVVYKAFSKYNKTFAVFTAAIVCPIVNTAVFLLGCKLFFFDAISAWALAEGQRLVKYLFFGLGIINFPFEVAVNIVLSPIIVRLLNIKGEKR